MNLTLQRERSRDGVTFGSLDVDGRWTCLTLEDEVREIPGRPVAEWKVHGRTAIPSGRYRLALRDSPRFGPDSIWVKDVPGFEWVLIHSGNDAEDTLGCIIVGDAVNRNDGTISGGTARGVLSKLKAILVPAIRGGEACWIDVVNAG